MLFGGSSPRKGKRYLIFLIFQIHLLAFFLFLVLWSRHQLKKGLSPASGLPILERKARFLPPSEENKASEEQENDKQ